MEEKMLFTEALIELLSYVKDDLHLEIDITGFIYKGENRVYEDFDNTWAECSEKARNVLKGDFSTLTKGECRMVETFSYLYKSAFVKGSSYPNEVHDYVWRDEK